uniref:Putative methyltransferase n=1 Tax=viral metagenome TaxID=1070528 RepID=A0A6M3J1Z4_9ZZZZ
MNTLDYIFNRWKLDKSEKYIYMPNSRQGTLTRLFRSLNFNLGCEVGVERAWFSKALCQANPNLKLYGVDPWMFYEGYRDHVTQDRLDGFYRETKERMKSFDYHIIRDLSSYAVNQFKDGELDFVYLDARHDYDSVKEDIALWHPKVRKDGIVSGHDYLDKVDDKRLDKPIYGIKKAVDEWVESNNIEHLFILSKDSSPSYFYVKS